MLDVEYNYGLGPSGLLYDRIKKFNFGEYCIWSISFRTWTTIMKVIPMTVQYIDLYCYAI